MLKKKIAIVTINDPGMNSAFKLLNYLENFKDEYEIVIYSKVSYFDDKKDITIKKYEKVDQVFEESWEEVDIYICFLATGIVVRKLTNFMDSKTKDPAVIVMSFNLKQIVPLISGHLGGANAFVDKLSSIIPGCDAFITTATDQKGKLAFDLFAKEYGFKILNIDKLARISNTLLNHLKVQVVSYPVIFELIENDRNFDKNLFDFFDIEEDIDLVDWEKETVVISPFTIQPLRSDTCMWIQIPQFYIGIGLNRNTSFEVLFKAVKRFMFEHGLKIDNAKVIASYIEKKDEQGLKKLSDYLKKELIFYNDNEINNLKAELSESRARDFFNIQGVAEPSAILSSKYKTCFLKKHSYYSAVTIAVAF